MKPNLLQYSTLLFLTMSSIVRADFVLSPLTSFGPNGDGTLRPNDRPYLTVDGERNPPHQRSMAYNPVTGHLLVVDKQVGLESINIVNSTTGEDLGTVPISGFLPGGNDNFLVCQIGVAEDGAIYVGNLSSAQTPPEYRLYRWDSETGVQTLVFPALGSGTVGDPGNGASATVHRRWGDTVAVRGAGVNTEVLIASRGTLVAILRPTDASMSTFAATTISCPVIPGALGFGLAFGPGNTFYGKDYNGALHYLGYDLATGVATNIASFPSTSFPVNTMALGTSSNLLVGIASVGGADKVQLYDVSNRTTAPRFLDTEFFATTNHTTVGAIAFGAGTMYALAGDNGVLALSIAEGTTELPPVIFGQPGSRTFQEGTAASLGVGVEGTAPISYEWFFNGNPVTDGTNSVLNFASIQQSDAGPYRVVASNAFGVVTSSVSTVTVSSTPLSTLFVNEPFNYTAGTAISNQGSWFASTSSQGLVQSGSLSYPGLPDSTVNHLSWSTANLSARVNLRTTIFDGSVYYSYIFQAENLANSASIGQFCGFVQDDTSTAFGAKMLIRTNGGGGFHLGVAKGGGTSNSGFATNDLALGAPVLVVGRYTYNTNVNDDTMDIWINPDPSTFAASNAPVPSVHIGEGIAGDLAGTITRFFFRGGAGNASTMRADELRVGRTWGEVTPLKVVNTVPQITIVKTGSGVSVRWPTSATDFVLEGTSTLATPAWSIINHGTEGDENFVNLDAESGNLFLRLKK